MPEAYDVFAAVYDQVQDTDIHALADYICRLDMLLNHRKQSGDGKRGQPILLDLGCGTGQFCFEMARRGYDPIGIDRSTAMLTIARDRMAQIRKDNNVLDALFIQQDIRSFELYGTVDLAVSLLDTVNHLTKNEDVLAFLKQCQHYLNPGGLLIFDVLSWHHVSVILDRQLFYQDQPDFTLLWQNDFSQASHVNDVSVTLFLHHTDRFYERFDDHIRERFYSKEALLSLIMQTDFELIGRWGPLRQSEPRENDERIFYILRKEMT
jgi:SAM-dependent methyltransferase